MGVTKEGPEWIIIPLVMTPIQHAKICAYVESAIQAML